MPELLPIIGREREIAEISELIQNASEPRQIICIHGEGGVGKTRLLQEIKEKFSQPIQLSGKIKALTYKIALLQEESVEASAWTLEFTEGVRSMTKEFGVVLLETDSQGELHKMKSDLDSLIAQMPDAIIIRGGSQAGVSAGIRNALAHQIKILTVDNHLAHLEEGIAIRATNIEKEGIALLFRQLVEDIDEYGKIAVVRGEDYIPLERVAVLKELLLDYSDIVIEQEIVLKGNLLEKIKEQAAYAAKMLLAAHPDLKAIWTTWEVIAEGIVEVLMQENRSDVFVYSFDADKSVIELMRRPNSPWKATLTTQPKELGRSIVRLALQSIYHVSLEKRSYHFSPQLITQKTLQEEPNDNNILWRDSDIGWDSSLLTRYQAAQSAMEIPIHAVSETIDFDDSQFFIPEYLTYKLALLSGQERFKPFFESLLEYTQKREQFRNNDERKRHRQKVYDIFAKCANAILDKQRMLFFMDTVELLVKKNEKSQEILEEDILKDIEYILSHVHNLVIIMAGRPLSKNIGQLLSHKKAITFVPYALSPLNEASGKAYLEKKQETLHIAIESELKAKLLALSQGKPILLDLAAEWRARGISLTWIGQKSLQEIQALVKEEKERNEQQNVLQEFEEQLVRQIIELRKPVDELWLLLSYIAPLNVSEIAALLSMSEEEAETLNNEIKISVLIKRLPQQKIKLHDEMARMVQEYVWPNVDGDFYRRRIYSQKYRVYLKQQIQQTAQEIQDMEIVGSSNMFLDNALTKEKLQQELWLLKVKCILQTLLADIKDEAKDLLEEAYREINKSFLFDPMTRMFEIWHALTKAFPIEKPYWLTVMEARFYLQDETTYHKAEILCDEILRNTSRLSPTQLIETLILRGNLYARLGQVQQALADFAEAVRLSDAAQVFVWKIRSKNALGWAYRQMGELQNALKNYLEAKRLYEQSDEKNKKELQEDYGLIINNLAFVLSNDNHSIRTAISHARSNLMYWKSLGNKRGLGSCHIVLGVAYYRQHDFIKALEQFQAALDIFKPLEDDYWLSQCYLWRGIVYRKNGRLHEAEQDLKISIRKTSAQNFDPMAHYHLGRVYMDWKNWDAANDMMQKAVEFAKKMPDFRYWLAAVARLIVIAVESEEYSRFEELSAQFNVCLEAYRKNLKGKDVDNNTKGIAFIALANLAFLQKDHLLLPSVVSLLKNGIELIASSPYSNADIVEQLTFFEKKFEKISPECIQDIGATLWEFSSQKETESIDYTVVTPILSRWKNWQKGENRYE